ncbi:MAG: hypothetical protein ACRDWE_09080, partial [Acidimicrobiales bacterium]
LQFKVWDEAPGRYAEHRPKWTAGSGHPVWGKRAHEDHLLYGEVDGENGRTISEVPLGNLVCEVREGRLLWTLYRYVMTGVVAATHGRPPSVRPVGYPKELFFNQNVYPYAFRDLKVFGTVRQAVDVPLSPEVVRDLYASALALPNDV